MINTRRILDNFNDHLNQFMVLNSLPSDQELALFLNVEPYVIEALREGRYSRKDMAILQVVLTLVKSRLARLV